MRYIDNRRARPTVDLAKCFDHRSPQMHVEIGEWLIEENNLCVRYQAAGKGNPLTLAAGELLDPTLGVTIEAHTVEDGGDAARNLVLAHLSRLQRIGDICSHIHMRPEGIRLEDDADTAFFRFLLVLGIGDQLITKRQLPAIRGLKSSDQPQQGGLAATRRAE